MGNAQWRKGADHMEVAAAELQHAWLLEFHLGDLAMGHVADVHHSTVVDVEFSNNDVVDVGVHLE